MRQRLGLADALVKDPSILILDEPTVNIDPEGVRELLLLVERLRTDQGVTVLLSSHLLHQVEQVCDRIGIFVDGPAGGVGHDRRAGRATLDDRWVFTVGVTGLDRRRAAARRVPGVVERRPPRGPLDAHRRPRRARRRCSDAVLDAGGSLTHLSRDGADLDAIYHRYFRQATEPSRAIERRDAPTRRRAEAAADDAAADAADRGSAAAGASSPARSSPTTSARCAS